MTKNTIYLPNEIENMIRVYFKNNLKQLVSEAWKDIQLEQQCIYPHPRAPMPSQSSLNSLPGDESIRHADEFCQSGMPYDTQTKQIAYAVTIAVMDALQLNYANNFVNKPPEEHKSDLEIWKRRPLSKNLCILYLDCIKLQLNSSSATKQSVYFVIGVTENGYREIVDFYIAPQENDSTWREIFSSLYTRGVNKVLIGVFNERNHIENAFRHVYSGAKIQRSFSSLLKKTLRGIEKKQQLDFVEDVKRIYQSPTREESAVSFDQFVQKWVGKAPDEVKKWEDNRSLLLTFYHLPHPIRCNLYNSNWMKQTFKEFRSHFKLISQQPVFPPAEEVVFAKVNEFNIRWKTRRLKGFREAAATLKRMLVMYKD